MLSLKTLKPALSLPFHLRLKPSSLSFHSSASMSASAAAGVAASAASTVEHVVLFKVGADAAAAGKADAMVAALRALASLRSVSHLHAGPVLRLLPPAAGDAWGFAPTHLLHSRYPSKPDLSAYASDPSHLAVVRDLVLPICDDILAVDWVNSSSPPFSPPSGSAVRLTLVKPNPGIAAAEVADKVAAAAAAAAAAKAKEVSFGENFSPARAKGYSFAMVAVFPGVPELDAFAADEDVLKAKELIKPLLDDVIVIDFVVEESGAAAASL